MAREFAVAFYHSKAWQQARDFVIARDHGLCRECMAAGRTTPARLVHHIVELSADNIDDPNISTSPKNLECVCYDCHARLHGYTPSPTRPGLAFDANGNLVEVAVEQFMEP